MNRKQHCPLLVCLLVAFLLGATAPLMAKENVGIQKARNKNLRTSASCLPSSASTELNINNVRCLLHNGGDMWWDLSNNPRYEVPKVDNPALARHSSFAASLWIGGIDAEEQLRVAAQTYRQKGNDFFPGPLTATGAVTDAVCNEWDKMYKIDKAELDAFRAAYNISVNGGDPLDIDDFPAIKTWPAFGENSDGERIAMAPFVNVDNNPMDYNPAAGDYPDIRPMEGGGEPDQAIWWVINDKGDIHTETGGEPIGLEIQMLAFAFQTANAINDMTFYKYRVINKSGGSLFNTYMGQWVDVDVGNAADDYVGCDTTRGLGYGYNGDAVDDGAGGYGSNPPVFGMDFFQGPRDEFGNRLDMTHFVYYQNDRSLIGNPDVATHYYGYLRGFWKDGSRMTQGGNGYGGSVPTNYMFPGDPAGCESTGGWSEVSENNPVADRRFLQSAGPFTLQPSAINEIITGAVWARSQQNNNLASICEILSADDLAQALFKAKFQLLDGPDAPIVNIEEFDQELVLSWEYNDPEVFNNFNESYAQVDPALASQSNPDSIFEFQGYMVFQLKDAKVSANELFDDEKARLLTQCDLRDGVGTIVNRTSQFFPGLTDPVLVDKVMVQGEDKGIFHSVRITEDLFNDGGDRRLKNYSTYYYAVIAYAYNETPSDGIRFVQGNRFFRNTSAVPHKIDFENFGTVVAAEYGDGIPITQVQGIGNGGNLVKLQTETEAQILAQGSVANIGYQAGFAPVNLKVVNAKDLKPGNYRLSVVRDRYVSGPDTVGQTLLGPILETTLAEWELYEDGDKVYTSTYIQRDHPEQGISFRPEPLTGNERVIEEHGFSIGVEEPGHAGLRTPLYEPVIDASVTYLDPSSPWLGGFEDQDATQDDPSNEMFNWILSGQEENIDRGEGLNALQNAFIFDPDENYETLLDGTWAPFCMARTFNNGDAKSLVSPGVNVFPAGTPVANMNPDSVVSLDELPDVDIVFTSDPQKWSRCVVVETTHDNNYGSGANPLAAKWTMGLDRDLKPMQGTLNEGTQGWSMFPGYAIDVNTGERLNIFFGENTWDRKNNGGDMLWNPTSDLGPTGSKAGGRHYVYVTRTRYDGCARIHQILSNATRSETGTKMLLNQGLPTPTDVWTDSTYIARVYKDVSWVGIPMTRAAFPWTSYDEIPTEARISLRVNQPFTSRPGTNDQPTFTFSTDDLAAQTGAKEVAEKSLQESIRVVPNPYYAFSKYERSQLQTIVKITNLPQRCKIKIFTLNGTMIRSFNKDSDEPDLNWDLKNQSGASVASGVYIIHVDGFELGEAVVKLMTVMPRIDLPSY